MRTPIAPNGLRRLIAARLFSRTQWRIWALAALVLAAYAVNIKLAVLYNDWNGRFFNALQAVNKAAIFGELFYFIGLAAAIIILFVWAGYVNDRLLLAVLRKARISCFARAVKNLITPTNASLKTSVLSSAYPSALPSVSTIRC